MTLPVNTIYHYPADSDLDAIPKNPAPFYVLAKEGIFVKKTNVLGTSVVRAPEMPSTLGELTFKNGYFSWEAPVVPAEICAQIVDFFRRIWFKHHTEAEVLLTARYEMEEGYSKLKDWRVFIPTQDVSGGGVHSVYEPTHIAKDHLIVGTMHSHCNFSPFHSGIDINDASSFDGVHFTIGYVDRQTPEVASMVAMSGIRVDFKPEVLADFSDLGAATAPAWWDNYVTPTKHGGNKAIGSKYFDKYNEKKPSYTPTPSSVPQNWEQGWRSNYTPTNPTVYPPRVVRTLKEIEEEENKKGSHADTNLIPYKKEEELSTDRRTYTSQEWEDLMDQAEDEYWEDNADAKMRDILFDKGLLNDDDVEDLVKSKTRWNIFLQQLMFKKLVAARDVLTLMGVGVDISYVGIKPVRKAKLSPMKVVQRRSRSGNNKQSSTRRR